VLNAVYRWDDSVSLLDYGFAQPPADPAAPGPVLDVVSRTDLPRLLGNDLATPPPATVTPPPAPRATPTLVTPPTATPSPAPPRISTPVPRTTLPPTAVAPGTTAAPPPERSPMELLPWGLGILLLGGALWYAGGRRRPAARPPPSTPADGSQRAGTDRVITESRGDSDAAGPASR
jgi:hypothetical protein